MSRSSDRANSVVAAVEQVAQMYGVPCYRMQSRVFTVPGRGGKNRPMFVGQWRDDLGVIHHGGMADLLLHPRIWQARGEPSIPVPLWVEAKSGSGELEPEQVAFARHVMENGGFYLVAKDSADEVLAWFKAQGVARRNA